MARQSTAAKAGALWRAGIDPPKPPKELTRAAKAYWRKITGCKPADFFDEGSLPLLADYCRACARADQLDAALGEDAPDAEWLDSYKKLAGMKATAATKLRLSVQVTTDRKSGKLNERQSKTDGLIGGQAAKWPGEKRKLN